MNKNPFDPESQSEDLSAKIVVGLERVSEAFRVLLWDHAKVIGLSPIQIQLLIFIDCHPAALCNVSDLALEFNLTKPTISDAVKVLVRKSLLLKTPSEEDKRAHSLSLTRAGKKVVQETQAFADPIRKVSEELPPKEREVLFAALSQVIWGLNKAGILTVQRTCFNCAYFESGARGNYCHLLKSALPEKEIRLDCPEFQVPTA